MSEREDKTPDPQELSIRRRVNEIIAELKETGRMTQMAESFFRGLEPEEQLSAMEALLRTEPLDQLEMVLKRFSEVWERQPKPNNITRLDVDPPSDLAFLEGIILDAGERIFSRFDQEQGRPEGSSLWRLAQDRPEIAAARILRRKILDPVEPSIE